MLSLTKATSFVLVLAFLELLAIREITNINLSFNYNSSFTFLVTALIIILYKMSRDKVPVCKFSGKIFLGNLLLFIGYCFFVVNISKTYSLDYLSSYTILFAICVAFILLALFLSFFDFKSIIKNSKIYAFEMKIFIIVILLISVLFDLIREHMWLSLSRPTTFIAYKILRIFGYDMVPVFNPIQLKHELVDVLIFAPCSGLEGILFFVMVFSALLIYDGKVYSRSRILLGYFLGMIYMLFLNLIRIIAFVMVSVWAAEKWGTTVGEKILTDFFHSNAGWFFYLIGIIIFITAWCGNRNKLTS